MICGIKIVINSGQLVKKLLCNSLMQFITPVDEVTGEIHYPKKARYRNLHFYIYESNRVEIRGSLHKYFKGENHSDFTFTDLRFCLDDLQNTLEIDLKKAYISNLEFGVNVSPAFNAYEFCDSLIAYGGKPFVPMQHRQNQHCIGFECKLSQYTIKIYDKARQYNKPENILRVEIAVNRMAYLSDTGKLTLASLKEKPVLEALGRKLLSDYAKGVICAEKVNKRRLSANEERIYTLCSNPKNWERFNRKQRYKRKRQFDRIIATHSQQNKKNELSRLIADKLPTLLNT